MELYQLRTFKMVAEEGHLTRAAQKLHASQPAVSAHIKNLEDELSVNLFLRTPKGMVLTDEGVELKDYADRAIRIVDEMASHAGQMQGTLGGALRIGLNSEPDFLRISELFSSIKARHPKLHIHLLQSMTGEVLNKLEDGTLDAGFMYGDNKAEKIHTLELHKMRLVVAGPIGWKDKLEKASPEDLEKLPWIMTPDDCPFHTVTKRFFDQHKIKPSQVALADQEAVIKTMIKAGAGLSMLLEDDVNSFGTSELSVWKKEDLFLHLSVACLKRRKNELLLRSVFSTLAGIWGGVEVAEPTEEQDA